MFLLEGLSFVKNTLYMKIRWNIDFINKMSDFDRWNFGYLLFKHTSKYS